MILTSFFTVSFSDTCLLMYLISNHAPLRYSLGFLGHFNLNWVTIPENGGQSRKLEMTFLLTVKTLWDDYFLTLVSQMWVSPTQRFHVSECIERDLFRHQHWSITFLCGTPHSRFWFKPETWLHCVEISREIKGTDIYSTPMICKGQHVVCQYFPCENTDS